MNTPDWTKIRNHYKRYELEILNAGAGRYGIDAYAWEFEADIRLTPIEQAFWSDIRCAGCVFYPQYPVGRYFVDFANPAAMVAIECDGVAWHKDQARDAKRQAEIERMGWTVYRIGGKSCVANTEQVETETGATKATASEPLRMLRWVAKRHGLFIGK